MPKFILPRNAGAHRIASIGLFRALLRQSASLPVPASDVQKIQNLVRHKFKKSQHIHGWKKLAPSFQAGYLALNHIHSATATPSSTDSLSYIQSLLSRLPAALTTPPPVGPLLPIPKSPSPHARHVDYTPITARPRPSVPGRRRIPVLTQANRYPFLRIKKEQPHTLGAFIRRRVRKTLRRHENLQRLELERRTALWEDQWDGLVLGLQKELKAGTGSMKRESVNVEGNSWSWGPRLGLAEVDGKLREEFRKKLERGRLLKGIVEQERELAEKEDEERKAAKTHAKLERRAVKRADGPVGEVPYGTLQTKGDEH